MKVAGTVLPMMKPLTEPLALQPLTLLEKAEGKQKWAMGYGEDLDNTEHLIITLENNPWLARPEKEGCLTLSSC